MLVSLVQSEVIALSLNIYVVAKPTRFKKGPCCWMLYELVQQSGVSKSKSVLRSPSKFQTRLGFFPWVKGIPFSYNVFLYPSQRLVSLLGTPLSQCSPCCEGLKPCSASQDEDGAPTDHSRSKAVSGAWPAAELCGDLCALRSWSTLEIAEITDEKHFEQRAGQICCIAGFWESL